MPCLHKTELSLLMSLMWIDTPKNCSYFFLKGNNFFKQELSSLCLETVPFQVRLSLKEMGASSFSESTPFKWEKKILWVISHGDIFITSPTPTHKVSSSLYYIYFMGRYSRTARTLGHEVCSPYQQTDLGNCHFVFISICIETYEMVCLKSNAF